MVSVIVPVYNVEKYLPECLRSIAGQSYSDLEVILVDDGSTDDSGKICDQWAKQDSRFRVIHQENQGPSAARNAGLEAMQGEYVLFVDSDDMIHPQMVELFLSIIGHNDVAICSQIKGANFDWKPIGSVSCKEYDPQTAIERMLYQRGLHCSICGRMYRQSVYAYLRFRTSVLYEDLDIAYKLLSTANGKIVVTKAPLYFYRQREGSILHHFSLKRLGVLDVVDRIETFFKQHQQLSKAARDRKFAANYNMYGIARRCGASDEVVAQCWNTIVLLRREVLFNPKSRLKNKLGALLSYFGPKVTQAMTKIMYS